MIWPIHPRSSPYHPGFYPTSPASHGNPWHPPRSCGPQSTCPDIARTWSIFDIKARKPAGFCGFSGSQRSLTCLYLFFWGVWQDTLFFNDFNDKSWITTKIMTLHFGGLHRARKSLITMLTCFSMGWKEQSNGSTWGWGKQLNFKRPICERFSLQAAIAPTKTWKNCYLGTTWRTNPVCCGVVLVKWQDFCILMTEETCLQQITDCSCHMVVVWKYGTPKFGGLS